MTEHRSADPPALRRAVTDRLRTLARDRHASLADIQRQFAYDTAAAVAIVDVLLRVDGEEIEGAMRWIRHGEDGMAVAPNDPGRWGLMSWTKWGMIHDRRAE